MNQTATEHTDRELAVALAGGNALGAFEAGALCALADSGRTVSLVTGVSIGAVNAVLFAAPRGGDPQHALRTFWNDATQDLFAFTPGQQEITAALLAVLYGRPTIGRSYVGTLPAMLMGRNSLQNPAPLAQTLERLVDFDALSRGAIRCILGATALDPDEPCTFDSATQVLRPEHVLASAALPVLNPPVTIEGRAYVDGGLSANLPLEPIFATQGAPLDCLSLDHFALGGPVPTSLDAAAERLQSMMFAFQSERVLAQVPNSSRPMRVIHTAYRPAERESAGKAMDFSRRSITKRWEEGEAAMQRMLERLSVPSTAPGNSVERV